MVAPKIYSVVKSLTFCTIIFLGAGGLFAQQSDAFSIKSIYDKALTEGDCYNWLRHLTKEIGPRLAGTPGAEAAVHSMRRLMDTLGFDTVYLQPCTVPRWDRGAPASGRIVNNEVIGTEELKVISLGNTIGTGPDGVTGELVEVFSLKEVEDMGNAGIAGKIVFFNRPMDPTQLQTFRAYGGAVDQRGMGLVVAARFGAIAVLVRSMTTGLDEVFTDYYRTINGWLPLLEPYGLHFSSGGSGADISGLKSQGGLLLGFRVDSQRYFDFHHTANDVFENVNKRELELGAASITSLLYLIDKYGLQ